MRRTKEDAQKTKDNIMNAAVALFAEKGVAATSLEEIAAKANVTRGAIYWHFKNKNDIFDALHDNLFKPLTEMILDSLEQDHPDPIAQLRELCIRTLVDIEHNNLKRNTLYVFMVRSEYTDNLKVYQEKHFNRKEESLNLFVRYFEFAKEKGALSKDIDAYLTAYALRCYMKGIISEYLISFEPMSMEETAPKLIDLFLNRLDS